MRTEKGVVDNGLGCEGNKRGEEVGVGRNLREVWLGKNLTLTPRQPHKKCHIEKRLAFSIPKTTFLFGFILNKCQFGNEVPRQKKQSY
jgi:hypothetical protein